MNRRWELVYFNGNPNCRAVAIATEHGSAVTFPHQAYEKSPERAAQVAALVAAAPDMLALLKSLVEDCEAGREFAWDSLSAAREVIAKAEDFKARRSSEVEQPICNRKDDGSNPSPSTNDATA